MSRTEADVPNLAMSTSAESSASEQTNATAGAPYAQPLSVPLWLATAPARSCAAGAAMMIKLSGMKAAPTQPHTTAPSTRGGAVVKLCRSRSSLTARMYSRCGGRRDSSSSAAERGEGGHGAGETPPRSIRGARRLRGARQRQA